ncbi:CDP-alcohol phosphatidyltransferase family protein [Legionella sp. W05-934-2]|jgi:CDP-diacylglycerol--glycerol-3-phosphate 3-phosphatidyltransferase|uniref:CDP-alcohol phosphatidyltransferase family protein n=1 Tax=Legionella sp. W05-934-2 TaxID=1198649 RepID=UPI0034617D26
MISIYDLKPKFQNLLRPFVSKLNSLGITANQVTLLTFLMCLFYGMLLSIFIQYRFILVLFPVVLFLRMAFNAVDGMLAKEFHQKSPQGALLNELTDILADAALYLPFAFHPGLQPIVIILCVILAITTETAGLACLLIGASRRYDGPMGKSDRAFIFSVIALWLAFYHANFWLNLLIVVVLILLGMTVLNRCYQALKQVEAI